MYLCFEFNIQGSREANVSREDNVPIGANFLRGANFLGRAKGSMQNKFLVKVGILAQGGGGGV